MPEALTRYRSPMALRGRRVALVVLCLCALTTGLDMTIVNLALPFIGRDLHASISELQWVIDAYNIVIAGLLVLGGGLADRYGRKIVFLSGFALFGVVCLLAALSGSAEALIASRALMGVGAAGVVAPALAIISMLYPPEERGPAIAAFAVFGAAGLAIGPVVGGILLDQFWWGSIFLVNVPIVAAGVAVGLRAIPESRKEGARRLDVTGALLSVFGLGVFLFGVIEGPERGWLSLEVLGSLVVGIGLIVAFVLRELRTDAPLFDVRILRERAVSAGSITLFTAYWIFTGMLFLLPSWLQEVQHESIVTVGLLLRALRRRVRRAVDALDGHRGPGGGAHRDRRWSARLCGGHGLARHRRARGRGSRRCWPPSCWRLGCRT